MGTGHSYHEFFYHFAWATRLREAMISPSVEPALHGYVRKRCSDFAVFVYALIGPQDHIHIVCSVPPRLAVTEFLDKAKGGSSHFINHLPDRDRALYWQPGYGGLTFAKRDLARVVAYVENQKQHHRDGTLWPSLERFRDNQSGGDQPPEPKA